MREIICEAIQNRNLLFFVYKGHERIVEPHLLGEKTETGNIVLNAWQVSGYSESYNVPPWRNYLLDEITNLTVLNKTFSGARSGYNAVDKTMSRIICRL